MVRFLKTATDPALTPVFVHCQYGSDRTGMMCAAYRVVVCGWSNDEAIDEMVNGGFGFHRQWQDLVEFIRRLDVDRIKKQLQAQEGHSSQPAFESKLGTVTMFHDIFSAITPCKNTRKHGNCPWFSENMVAVPGFPSLVFRFSPHPPLSPSPTLPIPPSPTPPIPHSSPLPVLAFILRLFSL